MSPLRWNLLILFLFFFYLCGGICSSRGEIQRSYTQTVNRVCPADSRLGHDGASRSLRIRPRCCSDETGSADCGEIKSLILPPAEHIEGLLLTCECIVVYRCERGKGASSSNPSDSHTSPLSFFFFSFPSAVTLSLLNH